MPALRTRAAVLVTCTAVALGGLVAGPAVSASAAPAAHHYRAGDFDGDGHPDLVIGAPGADRVRISYTHVKIKGSHTVTIAPFSHPKEKMSFGTAFALGDFNGDGYADLAVSAPQYTTDTTVGAVFVYVGSKTGLHSTPLTIVGPGTEDIDTDAYNVISLAVADFNDDGYSDLVVGSYYATRVYHGSVHGLTTKGTNKLPERNTGYAGADSLAVGDFNADHHPDLVIGREGGDEGTGGQYKGQLDFFYGTAHGLSTTKHSIFGNQVGAKDYQNFGQSVAAGDFNGDGHVDVAAGVPGGNSVVVLFGGKQGLVPKHQEVYDEDATGVTGGTNDQFGSALAAGQITTDGFCDLVVGAPGTVVGGHTFAGAAFFIHGSTDGLTGTHAEELTLATKGMPGTPTKDADFGQTLFIGNLAGSARPDLVIGAPTDSQGKSRAGFVVRLLGTNTGVTTGKATSAAATSVDALFGTGLA
jgi:hypothetical protein